MKKKKKFVIDRFDERTHKCLLMVFFTIVIMWMHSPCTSANTFPDVARPSTAGYLGKINFHREIDFRYERSFSNMAFMRHMRVVNCHEFSLYHSRRFATDIYVILCCFVIVTYILQLTNVCLLVYWQEYIHANRQGQFRPCVREFIAIAFTFFSFSLSRSFAAHGYLLSSSKQAEISFNEEGRRKTKYY